MISLYSWTTFSTSIPVSLCRRMSSMAWDCFSDRLKEFINPSFACATSLLLRIIIITSSILSKAIFRPSKMWALASASSSSKFVRRTTTSCRKSIKRSKASFNDITFGTPFTRANNMIPNVS